MKIQNRKKGNNIFAQKNTKFQATLSFDDVKVILEKALCLVSFSADVT